MQLMVYLEINDLITIDPSAYRQQHNTQTALHRVIDDWLCNNYVRRKFNSRVLI